MPCVRRYPPAASGTESSKTRASRPNADATVRARAGRRADAGRTDAGAARTRYAAGATAGTDQVAASSVIASDGADSTGVATRSRSITARNGR